MDKKVSIAHKLGVPNEFVVVCLTLLLAVALAPYLGGQDLGLFTVPQFPLATIQVLRWLGPSALALGLLLNVPVLAEKAATDDHTLVAPKRRQRLTPAHSRALESTSKYSLQNVGEIVKEELKRDALNIDAVTIADRLNLADLELLCSRVWYPSRDATEVSSVLHAARATAFSRKYAAPGEDEKLVDPRTIQLKDTRPWQEYLLEILAEQGVTSLDNLDVLSVGVGNGYAEAALLASQTAFKAIDVSSEALAFAKKKMPRMVAWTAEAEDLKPIGNSSIDLYLSLRVYQSTLFGRRAALHEAFRILRTGGLIVVSIPIMYIQKSGEVLQGLQPPGSRVPSMDYANKLVERIRDHMAILTFDRVAVDRRSPFEVFVLARR